MTNQHNGQAGEKPKHPSIIEQAFNELKAEGRLDQDATCNVYGPDGELIQVIGTPTTHGEAAPEQREQGEGGISKVEEMLFDQVRRLKKEKIALTTSLTAAREDIKELEAWKESAMSVWPDMQEIGRLLNVGLGQSVHDKIIPGIEALTAQITTLQAQRKEDVRQNEELLASIAIDLQELHSYIRGTKNLDKVHVIRFVKSARSALATYLTRFDSAGENKDQSNGK